MNVGELKKLLDCYEDDVDVLLAEPNGKRSVGRVYSGSPPVKSGELPFLLLEPTNHSPFQRAYGVGGLTRIWRA